MKTIVEQLNDIYMQEDWHKTRIIFKEESLLYHQQRYANGNIHVYEENGEVLGYYERYYKDDVCFLYNVYVKKDYRRSRVFKELYRHFFDTMPKNINYIVGEKQKLGGKLMKERICHGKH